jgi:hypothetical protein
LMASNGNCHDTLCSQASKILAQLDGWTTWCYEVAGEEEER